MSTTARHDEDPHIVPITCGFAAYGDGWAVHGQSPDEALRNFRAAQARHAAIDQRPLPPYVPPDTPAPLPQES
jgi:hypothetical protein